MRSSKKTAPRVRQHPGARTTEVEPVIESKSSATRSGATEAPKAERRLARLEERYRRELMGVEERCELRDRIVRLRRKAGRL